MSESKGIRQPVDGSMDQETSPSTIPLSQAQDSDLGIAESSQSIISHSHEYGPSTTEENPRIGDMVEVYLRPTGRGRRSRPLTKCGILTEIKINEPNRVKTDTCPRNFRKILKLLTRSSTVYEFKIILQSQSEHSISQYYLLFLLYCCVGE